MKTNTTTNILLSVVIAAVVIGGFLSLQRREELLPSPLPMKSRDISRQVATSKKENSTTANVADSEHTVSSSAKNFAPKQADIRRTVLKDYEYRALLTSNDPLTASSWALDAMNTANAWDAATGNGAVVAVIDSGFALNHQDLASQWYVNDAEIGTTISTDTCWTGAATDKQVNGCDDDGNGYVDDWRGWDFVQVSNTPQAGEGATVTGAAGHGTAVAGIVGAATNNTIGVASLGWNTKVMPLQVLDDTGLGYTSDIVAAIYYAVDNGASIINLSLGGYGVDLSLRGALSYAEANDVVVVAASGNCGTGSETGCDPNEPGAMTYPAVEPSVIAVGATTSSNIRASFSSYGPQLDIVAPGSGAIASTYWTAGNPTTAYATNLYGTSFAAPFVSSLAALIKSIRPNTSTDDIVALLAGTAHKPSGMNNAVYTPRYGHGVIDAQQALTVAAQLNASPTSTRPILRQAGDARNEHSASPTSSMGSGCQTAVLSYCSIQFAHDTSGATRYLPYQSTATSDETGWTWLGADVLDVGGEWQVRAIQGELTSAVEYKLSDR